MLMTIEYIILVILSVSYNIYVWRTKKYKQKVKVFVLMTIYNVVLVIASIYMYYTGTL